ncbi:MAG: T9SS type A sorting domain-containing protein [Candidatus Cloacimonetes bacterium]|nr:T9SS type A sorting domain-containing protein [Candidatus Cloacimonadota bacterium]
MRTIFFAIVILFSLSLLWGFSVPVEIDGDLDGSLKLNYEKNVQLINGKIWVLYYDVASYPQYTRLKLARETENGSFEIYELESMSISSSAATNLDCTFAIEDDNVTIFYKKTINDDSILYLYKIQSDDLMDDWNYCGQQNQYANVQDMELKVTEDGLTLVLLQNEFSGTYGICGMYYEYRCGGEFNGTDVLWGPVHSKDDIYIRHQGGGTNNNWPTFHDFVTTEGRIMDAATGQPAIYSAPMDNIFLGGYAEEVVNNFSMPSTSLYIRTYGFDLNSSQNRDVLYVKIDGTTSICRFGDYIDEPDTMVVYNSFPDEEHPLVIGDSIWANEMEIPVIDWDDMSFALTVLNSSVFVHCDLWIEGSVSGRQAWGCAENIYITSDLLYNDTTPGTEPSLTCPNSLMLCSEENIYIKYKNYDPDTETIQNDNCDGVYIYAMLMALGMPEGNGYQSEYTAGGLRAEYLHPHGSTPGFMTTLPNGIEWDIPYPDLHKYVYSDMAYWSGDPGFLMHSNTRPTGYPACGFPYEDPAYGDGSTPPYGTDFPWYNPVYPESSEEIVFDRGTIEIWGGLYERRFQHIYCNGIDGMYHFNNIWDPENHYFGGTHAPCGYEVELNFDFRAQYSNGIYIGLGETVLDTDYEVTILTSGNNGNSFVQQAHQQWTSEGSTGLQRMLTDIDGDRLGIIYSTNSGIRSHLFNLDNHYLETFDLGNNFDGRLSSLRLIDETFYFRDDQNVYEWDYGAPETLSALQTGEFYDFKYLPGFAINWDAEWQSDELEFEFYLADEDWDFEQTGEATLEETYDVDEASLKDGYLTWTAVREGLLLLHTQENWGEGLYFSRGEIDNITPVDENEAPEIMKLLVYPNPFYNNENRNMISLDFSLPENESGSLVLYNLRGQELEKWQINGSGYLSYEPAGLSSGLYLVKLISSKGGINRKLIVIK